MRITITTTFDISEENKPLISVVSGTLWYEAWVGRTIYTAAQLARAEDPDFDMANLVVDTSVNTFVKQYLEEDYTMRLKNIVSPSIDQYFGLIMQEQATAAKGQLDTAIETTVTITE